MTRTSSAAAAAAFGAALFLAASAAALAAERGKVATLSTQEREAMEKGAAGAEKESAVGGSVRALKRTLRELSPSPGLREREDGVW